MFFKKNKERKMTGGVEKIEDGQFLGVSLQTGV